MKAVKITVVLLAALLALGVSTTSYAFHSGGVAECEGCHSMHSPVSTDGMLLIRGDASSTCLSCHGQPDTAPSSYHVMTYPVPAAGLPPVERTPGGDFAWLGKNYTYVVRGTTTNEMGQSHGHNVIAADFGLSADTDFTVSPGGSFPVSQLGCQSCHDQHGKLRRIGGDVTYTYARTGAPIIGSGSYDTSAVPTATAAVGAFRLLRGTGDTAIAGVTWNGIFTASVPGTYNRSEAATQTRTAYGSGGTNTVGQWCASCHADMHTALLPGGNVHPIDRALGTTIAGNYNAYVSSGIMTGSATTSFLSLVPFAENTNSFTVLKSHAVNNNSYLNGPATADQVMCLSCHRAHASAWPEMIRWNYGNEFLTLADATGAAVWPGTDTTASRPQNHHGRTSAETQAAYYDRAASTFGAAGFQRQLCNKCHAQD